MRHLVVMRHGKAQPYADSDHARELTDKGRAEAADAGRFVAEHGIEIDHALVSTATRTQQTWAEVAPLCGPGAIVEVEESLYAASPEAMVERVRQVPPTATNVLVVGHNPGAAYLSYLLDDGQGEPEVVRRLLDGFPTAATAVFEVPGEWADLAEASARIVAFHR